jgi:hypothetical protein
MIEELVKAISLLFKFGGGYAEILYLLMLLQVLVFLVLELLFKEGILRPMIFGVADATPPSQ